MEKNFFSVKDVKNFIEKHESMYSKFISMYHVHKDLEYNIKYGSMSYTDWKRIVAGLPHYIIADDEKNDMIPRIEYDVDDVHAYLTATSLHETAHINWSSLQDFKDFQNKVAVKLATFGIEKQLGTRVGAQLLNGTEDGRIERKMIERNGFKPVFKFKNGVIWNYSDLLKQQKDAFAALVGLDTSAAEEFSALLWSVGSIAKVGIYPKNFTTKYEGSVLETNVDSVRDLIITATEQHTSRKCVEKTWEIYLALEDYLVELLLKIQENEKVKDAVQNAFGNDSDYNNEGDESGDGEGSEGEGSEGSEGEGSEGKSVKGKKHHLGLDGEETGGYKGLGENDESGKPGMGGNSRGMKKGMPSEEALNKKFEENAEEAKQMAKAIMEEDRGSKTKKNVKDVFSEEDRKKYEADIKNEVCSKMHERERASFEQIPRKYQLKALPANLASNARTFTKEVQSYFKSHLDYNMKKTNSGAIDTKLLHKIPMQEYNIFMKKFRPEHVDAVVEVCWDGSGSMTSDNKQRLSAEAVAIIEEGLKGFVPLKIINFSGHSGHVVHHLVKDFQDNDKSVNYSMSYANSRSFGGGNKDGYSIRVCAAELAKRPEKIKILIVLSDGTPTDYYTVCPEDDVRDAVRQTREKGIEVVSIFFGDERYRTQNKAEYDKMYQKNLINCEPNQIHKLLCKTIRTFVMR